MTSTPAGAWYVLVMNRPRQVVALRVHQRDLAGRPFHLCHVDARGGGVLRTENL